MTSLSRKSRRTTLRRTIRKATAISLAWLGLGSTAAAQAPAAVLTKPTVTNWSTGATAPIAQTPTKPLETGVPYAGPIGTRVLVPNPTRGGVIPVQATGATGTQGQPSASLGTLPGRDEINVFRLSNDAEFNNRMLGELNAESMKKWEKDMMRPEQKPKLLTAADLPPPSSVPRTGTGVQSRVVDPSPLLLRIEPSYVVHRPLLFEEKNAERYGWDTGFTQPFLSAAYVAKDFLLMPANVASSLFDRYDTSAGKCPPGSPVPYLAYPPEITLFGATAGAALFVGTAFLIP